MGEEQNDLLSFFNKKDKLKTAAVPVKKAAPKKEEIIEPKVEVKPGKAVQDLRAIREAKEKSDDGDSSEGSKTPETTKAFVWSAQPQTKPVHKHQSQKDKDKKIPTQQQFPTLKQALSANMPTMAAPAPTPVSNAFTGLEDELPPSDDEEEKEKNETEKEKEKEAEKPKKPKATNTEKQPAQPKKAGEAKKKAAEKPKKAKSQSEEDVDKLMADLGLNDKKGGKKKGKK